MTDTALTTYISRAGFRSVRELSRMTGIPSKTLDRIVKDPRRARGFQLAAIGEACGMSAEQVGRVILRKEERNVTNKEGNKTRA